MDYLAKMGLRCPVAKSREEKVKCDKGSLKGRSLWTR